MLFGIGAVLVFINFLALRQAVTPEPLLGRMTSTMRWLTLLPAGPGALLGGWLGEHFGLRSATVFAGVGALLLALLGWRLPIIRGCASCRGPKTATRRSAPKPPCACRRGLRMKAAELRLSRAGRPA